MKKAETASSKNIPVQSSTLSPEVLPSISEGGSALQNYMARISKIPLLSKEEEQELAEAYFEPKIRR